MPVLLVGVGADGQNVRPRPSVGERGRFEYVPIPEKSRETAETRTFGTMERRCSDGTLADTIERIKPHAEADWIDDERTIREWPVHYDPNLDALTYGEGGKDQNVTAIEEQLGEGDVLGFYTGLDTGGRMHRYLFGYFTLAADPIVITDDTPRAVERDILDAHGANAHAKRFAANGELYAFDPTKPRGASRVAIVDGREPGGLLDRAVQLSGPHEAGHYYVSEECVAALSPNTTYLGGFKNPIRCDISPAAFVDFVENRQ